MNLKKFYHTVRMKDCHAGIFGILDPLSDYSLLYLAVLVTGCECTHKHFLTIIEKVFDCFRQNHSVGFLVLECQYRSLLLVMNRFDNFFVLTHATYLICVAICGQLLVFLVLLLLFWGILLIY